MIEREVIEFVAAADFTDDCRIRVELKKRITKLTIAEAKAFRIELDAAIAEASKGADELRHEHEPAAVDLLEHISPDCHAGKHPLHPDNAWDDLRDEEVPCTCACHLAASLDGAA